MPSPNERGRKRHHATDLTCSLIFVGARGFEPPTPTVSSGSDARAGGPGTANQGVSPKPSPVLTGPDGSLGNAVCNADDDLEATLQGALAAVTRRLATAAGDLVDELVAERRELREELRGVRERRAGVLRLSDARRRGSR
jgi:hypothetical protein